MDYSKKIISAQEAVKLVKSGDMIITGLGCAEGRDFLSQLHTVAKAVKGVTVTNCLPMSDQQFLSGDYKESFNIDGWFYSPTMRKAHKNGNVSFIPNHLHLAGTKRLAHVHTNIYVGSASMPDKHGYVSLSLSNTYEKRVIEDADLVILEINPNFPYTYGDLELSLDEVDYLIESNYMPPVLPEGDFNEKDKAIGQFIADYIKDGDCIQLGIGGIPNAVAASLTAKKNLGVHTEMLTTGLMKLAKMGVVTGKFKQQQKGKMICTFAMGTAELYEFLDHNPAVNILNGAYVNDPHIIGLNDNMISINTTLEVDLTGQCCSESIGSVQFSGTGGQADTAIGAQNSKNGKSFIALYSTAMVKDPITGERVEQSKIVPFLKPGAIVSLSRNDVDHIVTEYGVAQLKGTNVRERVDRLIAVAHPKFREELYKQAKELGII
ncbi:MAG: acetyl-CoA hydrolase/transferase family protein [Erysipelotrichaceae bacterium]|nr:acetyl-CoA hydrolase/transferase family protein [Erysipelotrichaceae bacterium]